MAASSNTLLHELPIKRRPRKLIWYVGSGFRTLSRRLSDAVERRVRWLDQIVDEEQCWDDQD
jgi:hypothetical protein